MTRFARCALFATICLAACDAKENRAFTTGGSGTGESGTADGADEGLNPGDEGDEGGDSPGTTTSQTDTEDGGDSTESGAQPGMLHPSCDQPASDPLPPLPEINWSGERPAFADWETLECDAVAGVWEPCNGQGDAACEGMCLAHESQRGVCIYGDSDIWCDGEGEVIGYGGGACWMCGPPEAHAVACCVGIPGFDCRTWPYDADGVAGQPCARHGDCEAGLECGGSAGSGYGICQCPEAGTVTFDDDACYIW